MTPWTFGKIVEGVNLARVDQLRADVSIAYMGAAWQRSKRMPSLKNVLRNMGLERKERRQTPEEMIAVAKAWTAYAKEANRQNGGPPPRRPRKARKG